jgi:hypothetical protein
VVFRLAKNAAPSQNGIVTGPKGESVLTIGGREFPEVFST